MTVPTYVMTCRFEAPPELVWRAWTEPELIRRWFAPGLDIEVHRFEPEPGGLWLQELRMGPQALRQRTEFREVAPPRRLVMLMSTAGPDWEPVDNPFVADWPPALLTTVTLEAEDGGTGLTLEWTPHEASEAQNAAFGAAAESLDEGWAKGMEALEGLLDELR